MTINNSPLEYLAAFALAFVAGVLATLGLSYHIQKIRGFMPSTQ